MSNVASELKQLRLRTGLSIRKFAALIGMEPSHYAYFEDPNRFKKPRLDLDFARQLARVMVDYGIDKAEVMTLAGVSSGEPTGIGLSQGEEQLLTTYRGLTNEQRALLQMLGNQMSGLSSAGPEGGGERPTPEAEISASAALPVRREAA